MCIIFVCNLNCVWKALNKVLTNIDLMFIWMWRFPIFVWLFKMGFTPCNAEQPLQGMKLQEKEAPKEPKGVC